MPDASTRIRRILEHALSELALASSAAARDLDFTASSEANSIAMQLGAMVQGQSRNGASQSERRTSAEPIRASRNARRRPKSDYPRFLVRDDMLIKIGKSKKSGDEYSHKAPREAFIRTLESMLSLGEGSRPHTAEQIIEELEQHGANVPVYQVYVTLAMLRHRDCITKHGRDGYGWTGDLRKASLAAWEGCKEQGDG